MNFLFFAILDFFDEEYEGFLLFLFPFFLCMPKLDVSREREKRKKAKEDWNYFVSIIRLPRLSCCISWELFNYIGGYDGHHWPKLEELREIKTKEVWS